MKVKLRKLAKGVVKHAIAFGGKWAAEHGVGIERGSYLDEELRYGTIEIKDATDPLDLFNPGKAVDSPASRRIFCSS